MRREEAERGTRQPVPRASQSIRRSARNLLEDVDDAHELENQQHDEYGTDERENVAASRSAFHIRCELMQLTVVEARHTRIDRRHIDAHLFHLRTHVYAIELRTNRAEIR